MENDLKCCIVETFIENRWAFCGKDAMYWELDEDDKQTEYPICQDHKAIGFTYREINGS